ncbi:MAG: hypothetical protein K6F53_03845 [Lachnospiraceae bacterium]|nr:hypothetical protein [Lachnospiraceae bacterium]
MISSAEVGFESNDELLTRLFVSASEKCRKNIRDFAGDKVLVEGAGYEKIWLETQPMGGWMYSKQNIPVALNNQLMFMKHQRADGRIPGSIALVDGRAVPQFDKFQGFCFPEPALEMYYTADAGDDYLEMLCQTLQRFDDYLWRNRDSDNDGCLESWCRYDTGEDNALRYNDAPNAWDRETPPEDSETVPMASVDVMSYSCSARATLSKISYIMGREDEGDAWARKAEEVRAVIKGYLWDPDAGTCFDRNKAHERIRVLYHNTLRAMYWSSIDREMAEKFVNSHLLNTKEFWTFMPLPSVAVSDPLFRNIPENNWSGQCEALTYQRAVTALENYGYDFLIPVLGNKLFDAIGKECVFVQQYDPFTGRPSVNRESGGSDGYGPAMLAVLEYIAAMYGVRRKENTLLWGCVQGRRNSYEQRWDDDRYRIEGTDKGVIGYINNRKIFETGRTSKIITDMKGNVIRVEDL